MRRLLFTLLIALTVLRGFVGNAMALDMARETTPLQSDSTVSLRVTLPCHGADTEARTDANAEAASADSADRKTTCSACDICHLTAVVQPAAANTTAAIAAPCPLATAAGVQSALLKPLRKPPIS